MGRHDYTRTGQPFVYRERVFGIDTGCCTGGRLTGLLLPEFWFLSVPSRANDWEQIKAQYRRTHPRSPAAEWDSGAEGLLEAIYDYVVEQYARILARLRTEHGFDQLSDREQARVYSAHVGEGPLASLLHLARAGKLSLTGLCRRFTQPDKAIAFATSLDIGATTIGLQEPTLLLDRRGKPLSVLPKTLLAGNLPRRLRLAQYGTISRRSRASGSLATSAEKASPLYGRLTITIPTGSGARSVGTSDRALFGCCLVHFGA